MAAFGNESGYPNLQLPSARCQSLYPCFSPHYNKEVIVPILEKWKLRPKEVTYFSQTCVWGWWKCPSFFWLQNLSSQSSYSNAGLQEPLCLSQSPSGEVDFLDLGKIVPQGVLWGKSEEGEVILEILWDTAGYKSPRYAGVPLENQEAATRSWLPLRTQGSATTLTCSFSSGPRTGFCLFYSNSLLPTGWVQNSL